MVITQLREAAGGRKYLIHLTRHLLMMNSVLGDRRHQPCDYRYNNQRTLHMFLYCTKCHFLTTEWITSDQFFFLLLEGITYTNKHFIEVMRVWSTEYNNFERRKMAYATSNITPENRSGCTGGKRGRISAYSTALLGIITTIIFEEQHSDLSINGSESTLNIFYIGLRG